LHLSLSWRRHWKLALALLGAFTVLLFVVGGLRLAGNVSEADHPRKGDIAGTVDLFDESAVHTIEVTFDPAEYEAALVEFADDGDKVFIEADLVIDGTGVQDVGLRLKGNSTLFGPGPGLGAAASASAGTVDAGSPESLPWLISFGEFVVGQTYQGHDAIAVRPSGLQGAMTTALNEALSLSLIDLAGEPAEEAAYAAFSVNGSAATLRLVVQEPGDSLVADDLDGAGALYKALSDGTFAYRGLDPEQYDDSFRQVTGEDRADLTPLIEFIRWVEESSDEEFAAGLAERLDTTSLARYLALHNLLLDFDDMTGPGQNYYLWYDAGAGRFTVVSWDLNLSFSGDPARGPYEGGFLSPGGTAQMPVTPSRPSGAGPRPGDDASQGAAVPPAADSPRGAGSRGGNLLAERFLEVGEFRAAYEEAYRGLYGLWFAGGAALETLDSWAETLSGAAGDLVDAATLEEEVATLRALITARTAALATDEVITG
jgi:spore coat protein CotH